MKSRLVLLLMLFSSLCVYANDSLVILYTEADTTYYSTFQDALKKAKKNPGARIQLCGDVHFDGAATAQSVNTVMTIDLNGYTLGDTLSSTHLLGVSNDTAKLTVTSSRPGGRIVAMRAYDGRIYAVNVSKGRLVIDKVRIEAYNLMPFETASSMVGATGITVGSTASLSIHDCEVYAESDGGCSGITASGKAGAAAVSNIQYCKVSSKGRNNVYGLNLYSTTTVEHCTIDVSASGNSAYGIHVTNYYDSVAQQNTEAMFRSNQIHVNAYSSAYGMNVKAEAQIIGNTYTVHADSAKAYGLYASYPVTADSCSFTVVSDESVSYGLYCSDRAEVRNCSMNAVSARAKAYGMYLSGDSVDYHVQNGDIHASAGDINAYSIYQAKGVLLAERCQLTAIARLDTATVPTESGVRGLFTGNNTQAIVRHCDIRVEALNAQAGKTAYGLYIQGEAEVDSCTIKAVAALQHAYGFYVHTNTIGTQVRDCRVQVQAPQDYAAVRRNDHVVGRLFFYNGYYTDATNLDKYLPEGYCLYRLFDGKEYEAGYRYLISPIDNPNAVIARLYDRQTGVFIGSFDRLSTALLQAHDNQEKEYTIVLIGNNRLSHDRFVVAKNTSLVLPCFDDQTKAFGPKPIRRSEYQKRKEYVRLELCDGAELMVEGELEVSAIQKIGNGRVNGPYGHIQIDSTSSIRVADGGHLQAWGYITGRGVVHAEKGATVYENLQLGDWKGGSITYEMRNNRQHVFPITHYFYQNIEAPVIYYSGAKAYASTAMSISSFNLSCDSIRLLDDQAGLFLLRESSDTCSMLRKEYDVHTDRLIWTVTGDAIINELSFDFPAYGTTYSLISSNYVLPFSSNTTFDVRYGKMTMLHDVVMLPGTKVSIAEDAQVIIPPDVSVYLYDTAQWGAFSNKRYSTVDYSPSWDSCPRDSVLQPACVHVNGRIAVEGAFYTTAGGARICGSDSTHGTIFFARGGAGNGVVYQLTGNATEYAYTSSEVSSATLWNADSTFTQTGNAMAGDEFRYADGQWTSTHAMRCMSRVTDAAGLHFYPLNDSLPELYPNEPDDHAYWMTEQDSVRWFVYDSLCQWKAVLYEDGQYVLHLGDTAIVIYFYHEEEDYWEGVTTELQDNKEGVFRPDETGMQRPRLVLRDGGIVVLLPDGRKYTLLGIPAGD